MRAGFTKPLLQRDSVGVMKALLLATAAAVLAVPALTDAALADADDFTVSPWTANFDNLTFTAGGEAHGAVFAPTLPQGGPADQRWASGAADLKFSLQRDYDSGLQIALKTSFEVLRDRLSYDNYGGNLVQKVYGQVQTGLGSLEVGMTDGAAYVLSINGPVVDENVSLDNPNTTFYLDPSTGRPFVETFDVETELEASLNYAKFSYYTPRLFGLQLGVSFTPSQGREVIPFLNNGPHESNRQKSIWETALSYSGQFEDFSLGLYGGAAFAHGDGKGPDDAGLTDWSVGAQIDVPVGEEGKFSFGGGYRQANTYGFEIYEAENEVLTEGLHLGTTYSWRDWKFGTEYSYGTTRGDAHDPVLGVRGAGVALGYAVTENLQATLGWQQLHYNRNLGTFYDGSQKITMNAVFLHLTFKVPGDQD
jgi:hypothetical protein